MNNMKAKELATPAKRVSFLYNDITIGEAIAIMEKCHYSMIPVLERDSMRYLYSLSTGDILHRLIVEMDPEKTLKESLAQIRLDRLILSCNEATEINEIIDLAGNQNYIPLVDGQGTFRGLLTRRAIIDYLRAEKEEE